MPKGTTRVHTASASETLRQAARRMADHHISFLVVVEEGRVVGVLTDRDIAVRALTRDLDPGRTTVAECMSSPAVVLESDQTEEQALRLMREYRVRKIPVVDDSGHPIGVFTADDFIRTVGRQFGMLSKTVDHQLSLEAHPPEASGSFYGKE